MRPPCRALSIICAGVVLTTAGRAYAQSPPIPSPYSGVLGGAPSSAEHSLTLTASLVGAYYDNLLNPQRAPSIAQPTFRSSSVVDGTVGLGYRQRYGVFGLSAFGGGTASYFSRAIPRHFFATYSAGVGTSLNFNPTGRTTLRLHQMLRARPVSIVTILQEELPSPGGLQQPLPDPDNDTIHFLMVGAGIDLNHRLTRRVDVGVSYQHHRTIWEVPEYNSAFETAQAGINVRVLNGLTAKVGYLISQGRFGVGTNRRRYRIAHIDAGADFSRGVTFTPSRRLTLSLDGGLGGVTDGDRSHYHLVGKAGLTYRLSRTLSTSLNYNRNVGFVDTLRGPVLTDALSAQFEGTLRQRIGLVAAASARQGQFGFSGVSNHFEHYFGRVSLRYAISSNLAVGTDYSYTRYLFGSSIQVPLGLSRRFERQAVRVFLNLWAPLIENPRRTNAAG